MRLLLFFIIVCLLAFVWWPQHEPKPVEETYIGDQLQPLRRAQKLEQKDYSEGLDQYREQLDAQEADSGL